MKNWLLSLSTALHLSMLTRCGVEGECEEFRKWSDDYILGYCPPEDYLMD